MRVFIASTISCAVAPDGVVKFEYNVLNTKFLLLSLFVVSQISTTDVFDLDTQQKILLLSFVIIKSLADVIVNISVTVTTNDIVQN